MPRAFHLAKLLVGWLQTPITKGVVEAGVGVGVGVAIGVGVGTGVGSWADGAEGTFAVVPVPIAAAIVAGSGAVTTVSLAVTSTKVLLPPAERSEERRVGKEC